MQNLSFFTAIKTTNNNSFSNSIIEKVDNYFYLGGKKAYLLQGLSKDGRERVVLADNESPKLARVAKVISYFIIPIPIALIFTKFILRSMHSFKVIDPKSKLEKGIKLNETHLAKLQELMPKIIKAQEDKEIIWLSTGNNLVFKLANQANFVFKIARQNCQVLRNGKLLDANDIAIIRFNNMIRAKQVCLINNLELMKIPQAKKIEISTEKTKYQLIVEEVVDINNNESYNEELYHKHSKHLNDIARQTATFVAKTGFNDVSWRNIPLIIKDGNPVSVGLIDLEHMDSPINGFKGDGSNSSRGLIRCLTKENLEIAAQEARRQGIPENELREAIEKRIKELESDEKLRELYKKNNITSGKEPLKVDINSLGLNLDEETDIEEIASIDPITYETTYETRKIKLRFVVEVVISEINKQLEKGPENGSLKGKRSIVLDTNNNKVIRKYYRLGEPKHWRGMTEEEKNQVWFNKIIRALIDKGQLFELINQNGHGFFIQA